MHCAAVAVVWGVPCAPPAVALVLARGPAWAAGVYAARQSWVPPSRYQARYVWAAVGLEARVAASTRKWPQEPLLPGATQVLRPAASAVHRVARTSVVVPFALPCSPGLYRDPLRDRSMCGVGPVTRADAGSASITHRREPAQIARSPDAVCGRLHLCGDCVAKRIALGFSTACRCWRDIGARQAYTGHGAQSIKVNKPPCRRASPLHSAALRNPAAAHLLFRRCSRPVVPEHAGSQARPLQIDLM